MKKTRRKFNLEMHKWLEKNAKYFTIKELVDIVNIQFDETFTLKQMYQYFWHHPELKYKYEQQNKSHPNKGLPIGSERIKSDGMVQIKIAPKKWEYKQRLIYEKHYGVKLTNDDYIIFLDQDRNNFEISNLKRVSRRESSILANQKLFSKNSEATKTGIQVAKLIIKNKEMVKKQQL